SESRKDDRIPDDACNNRPDRLEKLLARYRERGLFPEFPFGTDLTPEEVVLRKALRVLKQSVRWKKLHVPRLAEIRKTIAVPDRPLPYLERVELNRPHTRQHRLMPKA